MSGLTVKTTLYTCCPRPLRPYWNRVEASELGYRLAKGAFWSLAGTLISRGLMLVASILVARMLGKEVFGELGIIRSTAGMLGVFAGLGLGLTATKHVAEFRRSDPDRAGRIIGLSGIFAMVTGGLMALGLLIFAPWLAEHTINAPHLTGTLRIGALILFINSLNGAQTGALSGFEAFKTIAHVNLFVGLISFPILVYGAWLGGLTGAVWALAINLGLNWLLNHWALRKEARRCSVPFTFRDCCREWPILWKFSLPLFLSYLLVSPARWTCNVLLVSQRGGYSELATFMAALAFQSTLLFAMNVINAPLLTLLSDSESKANDKILRVNILSSIVVGIIPALPLLCFPEVFSIVFGEDYQTPDSRTTFIIVVLWTCVLSFRQGLSRILIANNLLWQGLLGGIFWAGILLSSAFFLVAWGAVGIAMSFIIAYASHSIVLCFICRDVVPKRTVFSPETVLILLVVTALAALSLSQATFTTRLCGMAIGLSLTGIALLRIWQQLTVTSSQVQQQSL